jgi:geranylgeranyl diphosphate synthase type 3
LITLQEMVSIHEGQALDLLWPSRLLDGSSRPLSIPDYLQMIKGKTSVLLRLGVRLLACLGRLQAGAAVALADTLGVIFQITDDVINLTSEAYARTKGTRGEDITEQKASFMVVHAMARPPCPRQARLRQLLALRTTDQSLIAEAIDILKEFGSIEAATRYCRSAVDEFWGGVGDGLPGHPARAELKALC